MTVREETVEEVHDEVYDAAFEQTWAEDSFRRGEGRADLEIMRIFPMEVNLAGFNAPYVYECKTWCKLNTIDGDDDDGDDDESYDLRQLQDSELTVEMRDKIHVKTKDGALLVGVIPLKVLATHLNETITLAAKLKYNKNVVGKIGVEARLVTRVQPEQWKRPTTGKSVIAVDGEGDSGGFKVTGSSKPGKSQKIGVRPLGMGMEGSMSQKQQWRFGESHAILAAADLADMTVREEMNTPATPTIAIYKPRVP
jgi:hypothetical protein